MKIRKGVLGVNYLISKQAIDFVIRLMDESGYLNKAEKTLLDKFSIYFDSSNNREPSGFFWQRVLYHRYPGDYAARDLMFWDLRSNFLLLRGDDLNKMSLRYRSNQGIELTFEDYHQFNSFDEKLSQSDIKPNLIISRGVTYINGTAMGKDVEIVNNRRVFLKTPRAILEGLKLACDIFHPEQQPLIRHIIASMQSLPEQTPLSQDEHNKRITRLKGFASEWGWNAPPEEYSKIANKLLAAMWNVTENRRGRYEITWLAEPTSEVLEAIIDQYTTLEQRSGPNTNFAFKNLISQLLGETHEQRKARELAGKFEYKALISTAPASINAKTTAPSSSSSDMKEVKEQSISELTTYFTKCLKKETTLKITPDSKGGLIISITNSDSHVLASEFHRIFHINNIRPSFKQQVISTIDITYDAREVPTLCNYVRQQMDQANGASSKQHVVAQRM